MITLSQKQQNFAGNVGKLLTYIYNKGFSVSLGECYRTPEQAALYAKQGKGIVNSLHCKKLAIDLNLFWYGEYLPNTESHKQFGDYWRTLNPENRWGGDWDKDGVTEPGENDGNHYEMKG